MAEWDVKYIKPFQPSVYGGGGYSSFKTPYQQADEEIKSEWNVKSVTPQVGDAQPYQPPAEPRTGWEVKNVTGGNAPTGKSPEQKFMEQGTLQKIVGSLPGGMGTLPQVLLKAEPFPMERAVARARGLDPDKIIETQKALTEGYKEVARAPSQFGNAVYETFASETAAERPSAFKRAAESEMLRPDLDFEKRTEEKGKITKYLQDVIKMEPQIASQYAAYLLGGGGASMAWMGIQIAGPFYEQLRREGVKPKKAFIAAVANAAAQAPLEALPLHLVFKGVGGTVVQNLARRLLLGGGTEFLTEWSQQYPELAAELWAKNEKLTAKKLWEATKEGMYQGLVAAPFGIIGGGGAHVAESEKTQDLLTGEGEVKSKPGTRKWARDLVNKVKSEVPPGGEVPPAAPSPYVPPVAPETGGMAVGPEAMPPIMEPVQLAQPEVPPRGGFGPEAKTELTTREKVREVEEKGKPVYAGGAIVEPVKAEYAKKGTTEKTKKTTETFDDYAATLSETERGYVKDIIKDTSMPDDQRITLAKQEIVSRKQKEKLQYQKDLEIAQKETELPTPAQIESGTYKKGRIRIHGYEGVIETPKGVERVKGIKVKHPVGYIRGVEGADQDQLDVIFGPEGETTPIFVVDQSIGGKFDEHKVMMGFRNRKQAETAHKTTYGKTAQIMNVVEMTPREFKAWSKKQDLSKPSAQTPPISEKQWLQDPSVRPPGYITRKYLPSAPGQHAQQYNRTIKAEYRQWLKNMGYQKPAPTGKEIKGGELAAKRKDLRSAPIRYLQKYFTGGPIIEVADVSDTREDDNIEKIKFNMDQKLAQWLSKLLGIDLAFYGSEVRDLLGSSGLFDDKSGTVTMTADVDKPAIFILIHESLHVMKEEDPKTYNEISRYLWGVKNQEEFNVFSEFINDSRVGPDPENPVQLPLPKNPFLIENKGKNTTWDEFVAEGVAHQVFKEEFWNQLQKKNPSLFSRFVSYLLKTLNKIRAKIKGTRTQNLGYFKDLEGDTMEMITNAITAFTKRKIKAKQVQADETIVAAAIRHKGKVYLGTTHAEAFQALEDEVGEKIDWRRIDDDGFMTSRGRYIDRNESKLVAAMAEQVSQEETEAEKKGYDWLVSEDLIKQSDIKTDWFKEWFKGSKIVDKNGKPLVMYHGTGVKEIFETFNTGKKVIFEGLGKSKIEVIAETFFTEFPELASHFARGERPRVIPAYLSVVNPFVTYTDGSVKQTKSDQELFKEGYDGIIYKNKDNGKIVHVRLKSPGQIKSAISPPKTKAEAESLKFQKDLPVMIKRSDIKKVPGEDTKLYKEWIKPSQVKETLYHQTKSTFMDFNIYMSDLGAHFGTKKQANEAITPEIQTSMEREQARRPETLLTFNRIIPVKLRITNPIRLMDFGIFDSERVLQQLLYHPEIEGNDQAFKDLTELEKNIYEEKDYRNTNKLVVDFLLKHGFDGVVYLNRREGVGDEIEGWGDVELDRMSDDEFLENFPGAEDSWIAFKPNQIKSAITLPKTKEDFESIFYQKDLKTPIVMPRKELMAQKDIDVTNADLAPGKLPDTVNPDIGRALSNVKKYTLEDIEKWKLANKWPKFVHTEQQYAEMAIRAWEANPKHKTWGDNHTPMLKNTIGQDSDIFNVILAVTSPQNRIQTNSVYAVKTYLWLLGFDEKAIFRFPNNLIEQKLTHWLQGDFVDIMSETKDFKVQEWARALLGDHNAAVNDMWIYRVMFGTKQIRQQESSLTVPEHVASKHMFIRVAKRLTKYNKAGGKWAVDESQAAIWAYIKAVVEGTPLSKQEDYETGLTTKSATLGGLTPMEYLKSKVPEGILKHGPLMEVLGLQPIEIAPVSMLEKKRLEHLQTGGPKIVEVTKDTDLKTFIDEQKKNKRRHYLTIPTFDQMKTAVRQGAKVYMTEDKKAGYVLHDGDLQKLFSNTDLPGLGSVLLMDAMSNGAKTLDCFEGYLEGFYATHGWEETSRVDFDPKYPDFVENHKPYWPKDEPLPDEIVFMQVPDKLFEEIQNANTKRQKLKVIREQLGGFKNNWERVTSPVKRGGIPISKGATPAVGTEARTRLDTKTRKANQKKLKKFGLKLRKDGLIQNRDIDKEIPTVVELTEQDEIAERWHSELIDYVRSDKFKSNIGKNGAPPKKVKMLLMQAMKSKAHPFKEEEFEWSRIGTWLDTVDDSERLTQKDIENAYEEYALKFVEKWRARGDLTGISDSEYEEKFEEYIRRRFWDDEQEMREQEYEIYNVPKIEDITNPDNWSANDYSTLSREVINKVFWDFHSDNFGFFVKQYNKVFSDENFNIKVEQLTDHENITLDQWGRTWAEDVQLKISEEYKKVENGLITHKEFVENVEKMFKEDNPPFYEFLKLWEGKEDDPRYNPWQEILDSEWNDLDYAGPSEYGGGEFFPHGGTAEDFKYSWLLEDSDERIRIIVNNSMEDDEWQDSYLDLYEEGELERQFEEEEGVSRIGTFRGGGKRDFLEGAEVHPVRWDDRRYNIPGGEDYREVQIILESPKTITDNNIEELASDFSDIISELSRYNSFSIDLKAMSGITSPKDGARQIALEEVTKILYEYGERENINSAIRHGSDDSQHYRMLQAEKISELFDKILVIDKEYYDEALRKYNLQTEGWGVYTAPGAKNMADAGAWATFDKRVDAEKWIERRGEIRKGDYIIKRVEKETAFPDPRIQWNAVSSSAEKIENDFYTNIIQLNGMSEKGFPEGPRLGWREDVHWPHDEDVMYWIRFDTRYLGGAKEIRARKGFRFEVQAGVAGDYYNVYHTEGPRAGELAYSMPREQAEREYGEQIDSLSEEYMKTHFKKSYRLGEQLTSGNYVLYYSDEYTDDPDAVVGTGSLSDLFSKYGKTPEVKKEKVLYIQEIQSDWIQKGSSGGFDKDFRVAKRGKVVKTTYGEVKKESSILAETVFSSIDVPIYREMHKNMLITDAEFNRVVEIYDKYSKPRRGVTGMITKEMEASWTPPDNEELYVIKDRSGRIVLAGPIRSSIEKSNKFILLDKTNKPYTEEDSGEPVEFDSKANAKQFIIDNMYPSVPMVERYFVQGIRRMIRYAAEMDFDRIAFTTGQQQVDRWDQLMKEVKKVMYNEKAKKIRAFDRMDNLSGEFENVSVKDLRNYIETKNAEKMMEKEPDSDGWRTLTDLRIGGAFLRKFYDDVMPRTINKIFNKKSWGRAELRGYEITTEKGTGKLSMETPYYQRISKKETTEWDLEEERWLRRKDAWSGILRDLKYKIRQAYQDFYKVLRASWDAMGVAESEKRRSEYRNEYLDIWDKFTADTQDANERVFNGTLNLEDFNRHLYFEFEPAMRDFLSKYEQQSNSISSADLEFYKERISNAMDRYYNETKEMAYKWLTLAEHRKEMEAKTSEVEQFEIPGLEDITDRDSAAVLDMIAKNEPVYLGNDENTEVVLANKNAQFIMDLKSVDDWKKLYNRKLYTMNRAKAIDEHRATWSMPITKQMKKKALREGFALYANADLDAEIPPTAKKIIEEKIGPAGRTMYQRVHDAFSDFTQNFVTRNIDRLQPIKKWLGETKAYMLARGIPGVQSTIQAYMEHGKLRFDESGAIITDEKEKGFLRWYDKLGKDAEKFFYWVVAKRAEALKKEDREFLFDDNDIKEILKWVGPRPQFSDYKSWEAINKEFKEFNNNILDIAQKSGLINKEFRDYMANQGYYVPFYRVLMDPDARTLFTQNKLRPKEIGAQIKKLKGSELPIGDPVENMLRNWSHLISESVHNVARREAFTESKRLKLVAYQDEDGNDVPLVEEVPWADTVRFKKVGKEKGAPTFVSKKDGYPVLQFRAAGKSIYFKVNDPELFNALGQMDVQAFDNIFSKVFGVAKRGLTFGATFGPAFRIKNFMRDTLHTFQISKGFTPLWDSIAGLWKVWKNDPDYIQFMASGMAFGGSYIREGDSKGLHKYVNEVVKKEGRGALSRIIATPKDAIKWWNEFGEGFENAARVQLYSKLKRKGRSHLEAAFQARDLMDFNMAGNGTAARILISTVPFLNARIQGLYRMGRGAVENPKSFFAKSALIAMASLMLWWANKDDDRYKELEDFEKFAWYHFWIGDKHFRIPKPFETGVLFSTSMEVAGDVITGNEEMSHVMDYLVDSFGQTLAFNPTPQAVRPIIEQFANKSFFTGRPIEPMGMQYREPGERFDPWNSETLRLAGKAFNVSPKRLESLVRGYLSTFGMFILGMTDIVSREIADFPERPTKRIDDYPFMGALVRQAKDPRNTKYMGKFFDALDDARTVTAQINAYNREGDFKKAREYAKKNMNIRRITPRLNRVYKQVADISADMKKTWTNPNLTPDQKKEYIDKLINRRNKLVKQIYDEILRRK